VPLEGRPIFSSLKKAKETLSENPEKEEERQARGGSHQNKSQYLLSGIEAVRPQMPFWRKAIRIRSLK